MMRLKDKIIVVTGATRGIGSGISRILAQEGAYVILTGRSTDEGKNLAEEIKGAGNQAEFIRSDISQKKDCYNIIDKAVEIGGKIDGLVNNAGIFPYFNLMETSEETFDSVMATNIKGPFFATQRALKYMTEKKSGSIVNIGSTHWQVGSELISAYAISKGALHTLTQHVSHHFAKYKIRCNWITVGWVLTPGELSRVQKEGHNFDWLQERAAKAIPSGRMQTPEDIAHACIFFLSDESTQVTGADLKVTGGFHFP